MNKQFVRYLQMSLITLDVLVLNAAFFISVLFLTEGIPSGHLRAYMLYLAMSNAGWLLLSFMLRVYANQTILKFEAFTKRSFQIYLIWIVAILFYLFFFKQIELSRLFLILAIGGFGAGLLFNRFLYLSIRSYHRRKNNFLTKILILGYNDTSKKLVRYFEEDGLRTQILGFVDDSEKIEELSTYPIIKGVNHTVELAKQLGAQEIYSTITPEQNNHIYDIMNMAEIECIRFKIVPNLSLFINKNMHIDYFNDMPIISLRSQALDDAGNKIKKRALDLAVSGMVIVFVLSWLIPLLALLIILESRGPVFFKQLRTGKNKKNFYCLKFRSMTVNKDSDQKQATKGDARVTRIGKIIRKTSLDEFPQFINVFKGEMSLVGPRPHMVKHTMDYSKIVDDYMIRQFLKPGITGWAQVNGYRGEITNPEQIQLRVGKDIWYLENWTLWLDIKILFLTVYNIVRGDSNAY
jgi:putative colanic acid biosysnthesis UDP-glucose lipid carrier transferase